jgi:hypothetical protein
LRLFPRRKEWKAFGERSFRKLKQPSQTPSVWPTKGKNMKRLITSLQSAFSSWRMKLASLALISTVALFCLTAASGANSERGLVGSWEITVTPGGGPPFKTLATVGSDGIIIGVDASIPPSLVTPIHGAWIRTGGHTFRGTGVYFIFDPDGAFFGTPGSIYTVRLSETIALERSGQAYNGEGTGKIFDPEGHLLFSFSATTHAERIVVE